MFLLLCQIAFAQPTPDQLQAAWTAHQPALQAHAKFSIVLSGADFTDLARGKVARRRLPAEGADRAMGAIWTSLPRDTIWVAIQDDRDFKLFDDLSETRLPGSTWDHKLLYQHLNAPWPIMDRHRVLAITNNKTINTATQGRIWERIWELASPSMLPKRQEDEEEAIWTPLNDGGWQLLDMCGGTLVIYHARSKVGGNIPQEAITTWAMYSLNGLLKTIVTRGESIDSHYFTGHELILRPDGKPIPTW